MTNMISPFTRIHMFLDVPPAALSPLEAVAKTVTFNTGEMIMIEGDTNMRVFFVLDGKVRAYRTSSDGREQTLANLQAGSIFNLPSVFADHEHAPATAVAVSPVRLLMVDGADFRRIASSSPPIALAVMRDLSNKLHHFTGLTHDLSLRTVRTRLARFLLLQLDAPSGKNHRWTHEEIAAQIGCVREVVSRTLRAFARDGLIQIKRQHITILDHTGLQQEAEL